jgi:hypothetical protein
MFKSPDVLPDLALDRRIERLERQANFFSDFSDSLASEKMVLNHSLGLIGNA